MKNRIIINVLAAGLLFGGGSAAHAVDLECTGFKQTLGEAGHNPPVSARVLYNTAGWTVIYTLANGQTVDRSRQYTMRDMSDDKTTQWHGWSLKGDVGMVGRIGRLKDTGHAIYSEDLVNSDNKVLATNLIDCGWVPEYRDTTVATTPPQPAPKPSSPWLVDICNPNGVNPNDDWFLAFDETRFVAEFVKASEVNGPKRFGSYQASKDGVTMTVGNDQMVLTLTPEGNNIALQWTSPASGASGGHMTCVRQSDQRPTWWSEPAPTDQTAPVAKAGVGSAPTIVALSSNDGHLSEHVTVTLGSQIVDALLDTGASLGTVPESIANALIASGEANWNADGKSILADGRKVAEKRINVHRLTLGGRTVENVLLSVVPDGQGMTLLGMQVLRTFGKFTIDADNDQLILG